MAYVNPPPAKVIAVLVESVNLIVELLGVNVIPDEVAIVQGVLVPTIVHVPVPICNALVLELLEENVPTLTVLLLALNVPAVRVNVGVVAADISRAPDNNTVPPGALTVI